MDCQHVVERLPWLLNGTLEASEQQLVERHLESCAACRAGLEETRATLAVFAQHLPIEALVDYADGRQPAVDPELLETHLASCRACADELALLRASREALAAEAVEKAPAGWRKLLAWRRPEPPAAGGRGWRNLALAASLAAVVAGLAAVRGWQVSSRLEDRVAVLDAPRLNVPVVDLYPSELVVRTGQSEEPPAAVPPASVPATLILNSQLPASADLLALEVRDASGQLIVELEGLRRGADGLLTLSLATAELPPGELILSLHRLRQDGRERLETYRFQVR